MFKCSNHWFKIDILRLLLPLTMCKTRFGSRGWFKKGFTPKKWKKSLWHLDPPPKGKSHVNFISFQSLNYKCIDHQLISSARLQNYLLVVTANVPKAMMAPDRTTSWCNDVFKPDLAQFLATTRQTHWLAENTSAFLVKGVFMLSNFKKSCFCLIFCINQRKHKISL